MRGAKTPLHPILVEFIDLVIAFFAASFGMILFFGSFFFLNSRSESQLYSGKSYRVTNFNVVRVYFQPGSAGGENGVPVGPTYTASGIVEGKQEWMDLRLWLPSTPQSPAPQDLYELEQRVPAGTIIPAYFFPDLKGMRRLHPATTLPPAEQGDQNVRDTLHYGGLALAVCAAAVVVLIPLRRACVA